MTYSPPTVTVLGSVRDLTLQLDKIGTEDDVLTALTALDGSIIPDTP